MNQITNGLEQHATELKRVAKRRNALRCLATKLDLDEAPIKVFSYLSMDGSLSIYSTSDNIFQAAELMIDYLFKVGVRCFSRKPKKYDASCYRWNLHYLYKDIAVSIDLNISLPKETSQWVPTDETKQITLRKTVLVHNGVTIDERFDRLDKRVNLHPQPKETCNE